MADETEKQPVITGHQPLLAVLDTDDQKILQPNWKKGLTGHTQRKTILNWYRHLMTNSMQKI